MILKGLSNETCHDMTPLATGCHLSQHPFHGEGRQSEEPQAYLDFTAIANAVIFMHYI